MRPERSKHGQWQAFAEVVATTATISQKSHVLHAKHVLHVSREYGHKYARSPTLNFGAVSRIFR